MGLGRLMHWPERGSGGRDHCSGRLSKNRGIGLGHGPRLLVGKVIAQKAHAIIS